MQRAASGERWVCKQVVEQLLPIHDGRAQVKQHDSGGNARCVGNGEQRLAGCEADVVIVGHTHVPMDRQVDRRRVINLGSVSNPITPGLQASDALLDADAHGYCIQLRHVEYDREAVIRAIEQARRPTPRF